MDEAKILIADDSKMNQQILSEILGKRYDYLYADDGVQALDLLHEKKILITRGGGFNWAEPDHFRIVYLPRMEVLKESLEDLAAFFDHYRQS